MPPWLVEQGSTLTYALIENISLLIGGGGLVLGRRNIFVVVVVSILKRSNTFLFFLGQKMELEGPSSCRTLFYQYQREYTSSDLN